MTMTLEDVERWRTRKWPGRAARSPSKKIRAAGDGPDRTGYQRSDLTNEQLLELCLALPAHHAVADHDPTDEDVAEMDRLIPWLRAVWQWNHGEGTKKKRQEELRSLLDAGEPPPEVAKMVVNRRPDGKRGPWPPDVHLAEVVLRCMRVEYDHYRQVHHLSSTEAADVVSCRWDQPASTLWYAVAGRRYNTRRLREKRKQL